MSRRGWKDQRAALFEDASGAFGAPEAAASGAWREETAASSAWSEEPPPVAPVRRKRARLFGFLRRRGRKRAAKRTPIDAGAAIEADLAQAPPPAPAAPSLREAVDDPPARRAEPRRARLRWLAPREEPLPKDLVGRDLAGGPPRRARARRRLPLALLGGGIVAALLLVTLRVEILRLRYAVAEVAAEEQDLAERTAQARFRLRELRDPARLRKLAAELGFVRPERVLQLELPAAGKSSPDPDRARAPEVAAAPAPEAKP